MRTRKEIENAFSEAWTKNGSNRETLILEVCLDIRDLLLKNKKEVSKWKKD